VVALSAYVDGSQCMQGMAPCADVVEAEYQAMNSILGMAYDGCVLVRREVVASLSRFVLHHLEECHDAVAKLLIEDERHSSQVQGLNPPNSPASPPTSTTSPIENQLQGELDSPRDQDSSSLVLDEELSLAASSVETNERMEQLYHRTWYVLNGICLDPFPDIAFAVSHLISAITTSVQPQVLARSKLLRKALEKHQQQQNEIRRVASMPSLPRVDSNVRLSDTSIRRLNSTDTRGSQILSSSNTSRPRGNSALRLSSDSIGLHAPSSIEGELARCGFVSSRPEGESLPEDDPRRFLPYQTHFCKFSSLQFAQPLLERNIEVDKASIDATKWRQRRRCAARGDAQKGQVSTNKVVKQTQMLDNSCQMTSTLLLHPFESKLFVVDEKDCITTWDYSNGRKVHVLHNAVRAGSHITALATTSGNDASLMMVGADDGTVRVWKDVGVGSNKEKLLSAFHAVPDINLDRKGRHGGWKPLLIDWQQATGTLAAAGPPQAGCDVRVKLWDMHAHMCWAEPTIASEFHVTTLHGCGNDRMLWVGCGDGSVHLMDVRAPKAVSMINASRATGQGKMAPVLRIQFVEGRNAGSNGILGTRIISATSGGTVMFWDPRDASRPVEMLDTGFPMTAFAAHRYAHKFACGSHLKFVKLFSLEGKQLSSIEHHQGFFGQRIGPVSAIEFHPYKSVMAFGAVDPYVYVSDP